MTAPEMPLDPVHIDSSHQCVPCFEKLLLERDDLAFKIGDLTEEIDRLRAEAEDFRRELVQSNATLIETGAKAERYAEALEKIRTSAPCKKDHMSFNSPNQECDQRIAERALAPEGEKA